MKSYYCLYFIFLTTISFSQQKTRAYLFAGEGSDERIFSKIKLDSSFETVSINFPVPGKRTSMTDYSRIISKQIDTSGPYIFIGVSLGGMICTELADYMKPEKIIIISSAKCRSVLPSRYKFMKILPLNKLIPKSVVKFEGRVLQPIVEPDRNKNKATFKSMMKNKNKTFMKRTVNMIINWDRQVYSDKIVHIHGTNDHTLPIKNIKTNYIIKNGSHMITLTRGDEINTLINSILQNN